MDVVVPPINTSLTAFFSHPCEQDSGIQLAVEPLIGVITKVCSSNELFNGEQHRAHSSKGNNSRNPTIPALILITTIIITPRETVSGAFIKDVKDER